MATIQVPAGSRSNEGAGLHLGSATIALVGVPLAWLVVALVHPMDGGDAYDALHDKVGLWLGVHFAQLPLALGLAAIMWGVIRGRAGRAAAVVRVAVPVWLVSFAAFDSVTGVGSGLAVRHADGLSGAEQTGAASTADYLLDNRVTADLSPIWLVQAVALLAAVIGTALVLRAAGASRGLFVAALIGALLVFHAGPIAAVGLLGIAAAIVLAHREGFVVRVAAGVDTAPGDPSRTAPRAGP